MSTVRSSLANWIPLITISGGLIFINSLKEQDEGRDHCFTPLVSFINQQKRSFFFGTIGNSSERKQEERGEN